MEDRDDAGRVRETHGTNGADSLDDAKAAFGGLGGGRGRIIEKMNPPGRNSGGSFPIGA